jgi:peptide/nickel transport system permease protein
VERADRQTDVEPLDLSLVATQAAADRPFRRLLVRRVPLGLISVLVAGVTVYWATLVLPGDAAVAILGQQATPERLAELRSELGLDAPPLEGFAAWASGYLHGDFGTSLTSQRPVWDVVSSRLLNSVVLMVVAAVLSTLIGLVLGVVAANRRDRGLDTVSSVLALVASALPEFVVAVFILFVFSVGLFHWFPAISSLPVGAYIWDEPEKLVLPVLSLIIVVTPYVFRMVRAATIEALQSDYCEVARLKGTSTTRLLFWHALPNALAPTIQVVALNLLYLTGGLVMVESVFTFPGLGSLLVDAITSRDMPVVQFVVVLLAVFFVVVNISADLLVLFVTPRKRFRR